MSRDRFEPYVEHNDGDVSRLILFPFATFEKFCSDEWIGREREWFELFNVLQWTLSYAGHSRSSRALLLHPSAPDVERNLREHMDADQITVVSLGDELPTSSSLTHALAEQPAEGFDLLLMTGMFGQGATQREERLLLQGCRRALQDGGSLLATFPLQDSLGNPLTAQNIQFLDAATATGFEQAEVTGCDGLAAYLEPVFWDKLRKQGRAAFDVMLNAFATISDDPSTLWMSRTAFYAGYKR